MSRTGRMNHLLGACRRSGWDSDTPNIAGILENLLKPFGLTQRTNRDYVRAVIGIMEWEKKTGINSLSYEQFQEYRGKQSSSHKEQKPRKEHDSNRAIYSSPLSQLNPAERLFS